MKHHVATIDMNFEDMTEIDLKKLGSTPYSEMNARACVRPEGEGYIAIIIPIFEKDGVRVLKNLELNRKLTDPPYDT